MDIDRVCVFDQGLGCWTGHWLNFNENIHQEVMRRGLRHVAFGNKRLDPAILKTLPVKPLFSLLPWTDLTGDRETDYRQRSDVLYRDLMACIGELTDRDLILFPTLTSQEIGGIVRFCAEARRRTGCRPALLAQSTEGINVTGSPDTNWCTPYFRRAVADLPQPDVLKEFLLLASSVDLSVQYSVAFGLPAEALCMPIANMDDMVQDDDPRVDDGILRVGYFGHSSYAKGGHLLDDIVQEIKKRHDNVEFILHVSKNPETQDCLSVFDTDQPRVTCLRGHISREDYYRAMAVCDIVLLPYDRAKYGATPSSVLAEALVAGKVVVVPENTWSSREVWRNRAGATFFDDFNAPTIASALSEAIREHNTLRRDAQRASVELRRRQNIVGFVDGLLEAARKAAAPNPRPFGWSAPVAAHWHLA
jgi:glycosyltransferase involved in cell wall biosynthesis